MPRMMAIEAAVHVLEKEGVTVCFGVPGAAINPLYSAMNRHGGIRHILARHVESASHMADGYTRAMPGNIGVCIGTSGPAGTDMITGLYAASADSIPILCITGQAPRARLHKEDFQAIDIESIAKPVTKWASWLREQASESLLHAQQAGEMITHLGAYPSLTIGPLLDSHQHDIGAVLRESLDTEGKALALYKELLTLVEGCSVMLEEYARQMVYAEEQHAGEVDKMLRKPGELAVFQPGL